MGAKSLDTPATAGQLSLLGPGSDNEYKPSCSKAGAASGRVEDSLRCLVHISRADGRHAGTTDCFVSDGESE